MSDGHTYHVVDKDGRLVPGLEHCGSPTVDGARHKLGTNLFITWSMWSSTERYTKITEILSKMKWEIARFRTITPEK